MRTLAIATIVIALSAAASAWAGDAAPSRTTQLADANEKLASRALNTKGAHRQELVLQQRKVQTLIDDLQSGKRVNPAEIDQVLQDAERSAR